MRIGFGYDVHQLVEGRNLILGGVNIEYTTGLLGHSDADVLIHAIMDAMLGALALGDIGKWFPDNDMQYKDIDSRNLLFIVNQLIKERNYEVSNLDTVIACQKPKLAPHIDNMRGNIADTLGISKDAVSVKATTTERLGFEGREEGISAYCVCMLKSIDKIVG